jgi:hypothetical protein
MRNLVAVVVKKSWKDQTGMGNRHNGIGDVTPCEGIIRRVLEIIKEGIPRFAAPSTNSIR